MKKSATKFLAVVLCLAMVLGTSISAMAVEVGSTDIIYDYHSGSINVKTTVTTEEAEEVTYMVHNADNFYSITKENIKYIDQKNVTDEDTFEYTLDSYDASTDKIFVGGETLDAPKLVDPEVEVDSGITVTLNGEASDATVDIADAYVKITLADAVNATAVTLNGEDADFSKGNGYIYVIGSDWTQGSVINITTKTVEAAPVVIKGSSFAKLTPAEVGTIVINGTAKTTMHTTALYNTAFYNAAFGGAEPYSMYATNGDRISGTYDWEAYVYYNSTAGTAQLTDGPSSTTAITLRDTSEFKADLDAIVADIAADGESTAIKSTHNVDDTSFVATIGGKKDLDLDMGCTILANAGTYTTEVYVPVAGKYNVFASFGNANNNTRNFSVTVNGQTADIGENLAFSPSNTVLDSQEITLNAGINEVVINSDYIRFDFLAFTPVSVAEKLFATTDNDVTYDQALNFSWKNWKEGCLDNCDMTSVAHGIKIAQPELTDTELLTFARVLGGGFANCGIKVTANGVSEKFDAIGVDGNGYFAIGLQNEDGSAGIGELFDGAEVSAYVDGYISSVKTAELAELAE